MTFFKMLIGGNIFSPAGLGKQDILIAGDRIAVIGKHLDISEDIEVERINVEGKTVTPGFIDLHVHITGGGGEAGPASRTPEINVGSILSAGVTTVLGVLGTDAITRSTEALVAKALGLEQEGITAYVLSGSYTFPNLSTLTGSLQKDITLIPQIIGVGELAISDHRSSQATFEEFVRVVSDSRVGGLMGGKPGLVVVHLGEGSEGMAKLFRLISETDIPVSQILPTHTTRNEALFEDALKFATLGGNIDITAHEDVNNHQISLEVALAKLHSHNIPLDQITVSSDSNGSLPRFNENKQIIGVKMASINSLTQEFRRLIMNGNFQVQEALPLFTSNPAARLGLINKKGAIIPSASADLVVFDNNWKIDSVLAKGEIFVRNNKLIKGSFYDSF